jgi:hypothetical protein
MRHWSSRDRGAATVAVTTVDTVDRLCYIPQSVTVLCDRDGYRARGGHCAYIQSSLIESTDVVEPSTIPVNKQSMLGLNAPTTPAPF